jgi:hypothetical protein
MDAVTTMTGAFSGTINISSITLPSSMTALTNVASAFATCGLLTEITMPATVSASLTTYQSSFQSCSSLKTLTLPTTQTSLLTNMTNMFSGCGNLTTINNINKLGSLTATPLVDVSIGAACFTNMITSLSFNCPMSRFLFGGNASNNFCKLNSVRLLNVNTGQWTGISPQINVSFTSLSTADLVTLFNDMAAQGTVVSKTISIASATGAAGLTAGDRLIITSIGWTITG